MTDLERFNAGLRRQDELELAGLEKSPEYLVLMDDLSDLWLLLSEDDQDEATREANRLWRARTGG